MIAILKIIQVSRLFDVWTEIYNFQIKTLHVHFAFK